MLVGPALEKTSAKHAIELPKSLSMVKLKADTKHETFQDWQVITRKTVGRNNEDKQGITRTNKN